MYVFISIKKLEHNSKLVRCIQTGLKALLGTTHGTCAWQNTEAVLSVIIEFRLASARDTHLRWKHSTLEARRKYGARKLPEPYATTFESVSQAPNVYSLRLTSLQAQKAYSYCLIVLPSWSKVLLQTPQATEGENTIYLTLRANTNLRKETNFGVDLVWRPGVRYEVGESVEYPGFVLVQNLCCFVQEYLVQSARRDERRYLDEKR